MNFILIPTLGLNGGAIATFLGFMVVLIIRENLLIRQEKLMITFNRILLITIIGVQIAVYYMLPFLYALIILFTLEVLMLILVRKTIWQFY